MSISEKIRNSANIKVVGVGGGGGNAINRMIELGIAGVSFIALNTDSQILQQNLAAQKLQIGGKITRGLGAGGDPTTGKKSAELNSKEISNMLEGADMVFITAGMGGGTGTGASSVVAALAKELGILTIGVVTKPFTFEGRKRKQSAEGGIKSLKENVDTLIVIPNDKILEVVMENTSIIQAFQTADDVLRQGVQGISDLITMPGIINLDFADVRRIMSNAGSALIGIGNSRGADRAINAANMAITCPLVEKSINGAKGVIINITGAPDMTLFEINAAAELISKNADEDANIIFGSAIDKNLKDEIRITVIATAFPESTDTAKFKTVESKIKSYAKMQKFENVRTDIVDIPAFLQ